MANMLIIKANPLALKGAESFLRNRDWKIVVIVDLKEAVDFILKKRPKYIMLPADHPNKQAKLLPKLIPKNHPSIIIGYTESSNSAALMRLQEMGVKYQLYPPISGPAILRIVSKIEKDVEKAKEAAKIQDVDSREFATPMTDEEADQFIEQVIETPDVESEQKKPGGLIHLGKDAKPQKLGSVVISKNEKKGKQGRKIIQNVTEEHLKSAPTSWNIGAADDDFLKQPEYVPPSDWEEEIINKLKKEEVGEVEEVQFKGEFISADDELEVPEEHQEETDEKHVIKRNNRLEKPQRSATSGAKKAKNKKSESIKSQQDDFDDEESSSSGMLHEKIEKKRQKRSHQHSEEINEADEFNEESVAANESIDAGDEFNDESSEELSEESSKSDKTKAKPPIRVNRREKDKELKQFLQDEMTLKKKVNLNQQKDDILNSEIEGEQVPQEVKAKVSPKGDNMPVGTPPEEEVESLGVLADSEDTVGILNSIYESLMLQGSVEALDKALDRENASENYDRVEGTSNVACLVLDSPQLSGYLVAAMGKNMIMNEDLMSNIKAHLFDFLKNNGVDIEDIGSGPLSLKIKEVPFQSWAEEQAEFLLNSVHQDNEVALAFFPTKDIKLNLEESFADHMLKMSLNEIGEGTDLGFDLFVFLPRNQKYVLYSKEGSAIEKEQKERLKQKGVTHVHLKKESVEQVRKHKVQKFLTEKIREFEQFNSTQVG